MTDASDTVPDDSSASVALSPPNAHVDAEESLTRFERAAYRGAYDATRRADRYVGARRIAVDPPAVLENRKAAAAEREAWYAKLPVGKPVRIETIASKMGLPFGQVACGSVVLFCAKRLRILPNVAAVVRLA